MNFQLVDSGWAAKIANAPSSDHSEVQIICPFIKKRTASRLLEHGRPRSLQVITRFNPVHFIEGVSDISALRLLLQAGAQIRGVKNVHAKLYLLGRTALITSANLTEAALTRNLEFGCITQETDLLEGCRQYFDLYWHRAGADLTEERLATWDQKTKELLAAWPRTSPTMPPDEGVDLGIMSQPSNEAPSVFSSAEQAFVKFFGASDSRASRDVSVVDEVLRSGSHRACTYPKGRRPRQVDDGAVMFMGRLVEKPDDILIYGRGLAMRHEEGRDDASPADLQRREWKKHWPHYVRVHHVEFLSRKLSDCVSLNELMQQLGENAFASTQENAQTGTGNTDPRKAYLQQPHVKLSADGFAWINDRLEQAFAKHGKLPKSAYENED